MKGRRREKGFCIPPRFQFVADRVVSRYLYRIGKDGNPQADSLKGFNLLKIAIILSLIVIILNFLGIIDVPIPVPMLLFFLGALFLAISYLLLRDAFPDFIWLGNDIIVNRTMFRIEVTKVRSVMEAFAFSSPASGTLPSQGTVFNQFELTLIDKNDYQKTKYSIDLSSTEEAAVMARLEEYFRFHGILYNFLSPQYYLELASRKKLSESDIDDTSKFIDEELVRQGSSDHIFKVKGLWHNQINDHEESIQWLERYLEFHRNDHEVMIALVDSLDHLGKYSRALNISMKLIEDRPDDGKIIGLHAKMLFMSGDKNGGMNLLSGEIDRFQRLKDSKKGIVRKFEVKTRMSPIVEMKRHLESTSGMVYHGSTNDLTTSRDKE